ncbi:hypothetical protein EJD97_023970 [Solanum chilense]|uniref:Integrase core domain containing protein n=1 Tax=Solanum chilense TaxID=4083 RepID=A0A6N2ARA8_SOLCI|nr:hypothetical protein EJD97_023970 [Solanum chilense]
MAPKQDRVYARGQSKSVAPSALLVIGSDDERDPEYVPPGTSAPSRAARAARATPRKVASGVVTASQSNEKLTLTGTPSGSATHEEGVSGSLGVDISLPSIRRYLYGEDVDANQTPLTAEFDYRWQVVKDGQFLREPSLRETTKRCMCLHLSVDGEGADSVTKPKGAIKKANRTFMSNFYVLMAAMIYRFEVEFSWLLQEVMHERAFKVTTTYPFPCMIFCLCRSAGVPIWNVDQLKTPLGTVDIVLIRDEANVFAPCRGPGPELPLLGDNLAVTVAQARTATQAAFTDTTPVESLSGSSIAPRSSRSYPFPALVPLATVQKLEAQIATLLHHIQPWMQRSIAEAEERLEQRMVQHTEWKIAEAAVDSLRADIDMILVARVPDSEAPSADPAEDTVMAALFAISEIPPPPPRENAKNHSGREEDEARAGKKERREMEAVRRALLGDEEARRKRVVESVAGASSSRNVEIAGGTSDSVVDVEETTEGV